MYLIQTVQTSWRPQQPLPKQTHANEQAETAAVFDDESSSDMEQRHKHNSLGSSILHMGHGVKHRDKQQTAVPANGSSNKKWSFGRLFRKKKELDSNSSSEEDRKAGFFPEQKQTRSSGKSGKHKNHKQNNQRGSKLIGAAFDHIVVKQKHGASTHSMPQSIDNEFFLPVEMIKTPEEPPYKQQSRSLNVLKSPKSRSVQRLAHNQLPSESSEVEAELISLNSSTYSKYRSDESIHSGGGAFPLNRRSRAARNERYYKRLSRDGEISNGQVPQQVLAMYNNYLPQQQQQQQQKQVPQLNRNMPHYVHWSQLQQQQNKQPLQNVMSDSKRSISYDSHIHLQNVNGNMQSKPLPPPPPPRDPLRRLHVSNVQLQNVSSMDLRPLSYACDQPPSAQLNNSDNKMRPQYQSAQTLSTAPFSARGFPSRVERDAQLSKQSLANGTELHYLEDATPRSRKPIHVLQQQATTSALNLNYEPMLRTNKNGLPFDSQPRSNKKSTSTSNLRASDFWKRLDEGAQRGRMRSHVKEIETAPSRSISSSRVADMRSYPIHSELQKSASQQKSTNEVDNVICGSLHIKRGDNKDSNYVEIQHKDMLKSRSMPNHYKSDYIPNTNKYEQYVAEKREQHYQQKQREHAPPLPPQRKLTFPEPQSKISLQRKKPANLEEAIRELEAIYQSLGLTEPVEPAESAKEEVSRAESSVLDFDKFALAHADEYDDEDSPVGEPDPVCDDVAYRNIKLANLQHKTNDKQLPFGIPIGPIVPAAQTDYLHVEPIRQTKTENHIVKDDLAVRALRKDQLCAKERFEYPNPSMQKKNRATRTQSANIYTIIQRDAAKPSGGDISSYLELTRNLDHFGSMSNILKDDADVPNTLKLLRNLKQQEYDEEKSKNLRHPSKIGAIGQLPEILAQTEEDNAQKLPVPMPRKSITPEPAALVNHQMEAALNKIAQDAQESSAKLSRELQELRKEALITHSRSIKTNCSEDDKIEQDLQEIEAVSEAAKRCGKLLLETLPNEHDDAIETANKQRKLHKEGKLIKAIDQVSEAANAVCEKILKDVQTQSHDEQQQDTLVMPHLMKQLDPLKTPKIEVIAQRCMRQLSELATTNADYDNITEPTDAHVACTSKKPANVDSYIYTLAEVKAQEPKQLPISMDREQEIEEIDKIMQECEAQVRAAHLNEAKLNSESKTKTASFSSSSDCLAKSSTSSSMSRRQSSSITSFNPYSSSDYVKSPSSEFNAHSTDPIKTFSTTSYEGQSTSATPNITTATNSTFSYSPSPPLPVSKQTAVSAASIATIANSNIDYNNKNNESDNNKEQKNETTSSQYNSTEELALIFDMQRRRQPATAIHVSGNVKAQPTQSAPPINPNANPSTILLSSVHNHASLCFDKCQKSPINRKRNQADKITNPASCKNNEVHVATNASNTCKLDTIQEIMTNIDDAQSQLYTNISVPLQSTQQGTLNQRESLSSLEEELSSNPDSGNDSLAEFTALTANNSCNLQLQTKYNSRYEIKNNDTYISEVIIAPTIETIDDQMQANNCSNQIEEEEFPRLPTAEELTQALKEHVVEPESDSVKILDARKNDNSIVYETPKLNMNISELKLNYEYALKATEDNNDKQLKQANSDVRKNTEMAMAKTLKTEKHVKAVDCAQQLRQHSQRSNLLPSFNEKPKTSMRSMLLGELVPAAGGANSLTTLEHVLIACSLGLITPTDLYTLCLLVISIITIIALVLL